MPTPDVTYKVSVSSFSLDHKIPPGDTFWSTFNASFQNQELTPYNFAKAIWDGHPFTTWHSNSWRTSANYIAGQYLALDFDTGDQTSTLPTLIENPFIHRHSSILYTTPSHTAEAPRARVVFLLDTPIQQAQNYTLASAALLWLFGTADRACRDAVRFWYGSLRCDMEMFDNVLSLATVKHIIAQYQASGKREMQRHTRTYTTTTDQAEVADALKKIPAWGIDYDEWVAVLMALHREYGDAGLGLAEQWADGQPNEVQRKWKSFRSNGNTTGAVGLGTVFALAQRFGWAKVQ